ncbi:hypothetical protein, partial [Acinetobacter baumannii]|uniref:hypothetical protein n=1 Tax=Acinetobacter baumannii TaxID=470 RepID=UPI001BC87E52
FLGGVGLCCCWGCFFFCFWVFFGCCLVGCVGVFCLCCCFGWVWLVFGVCCGCCFGVCLCCCFCCGFFVFGGFCFVFVAFPVGF